MYQKIDASAFQQVFVVGDLHGCYDLLMSELDSIGFNPETDLLVSVGDLIDRGAQNIECLRLIDEKWFRAVQGNHDQMAMDGLLHDDLGHLSCWLRNGGNWFFKLSDYDKAEVLDLLKKVRKQPLILDIEMPTGKKVIVAHADYPDDHYQFDKEFIRRDILWDRERLKSRSEMAISGADLFVFGHTPVDEPTHLGNRLYIDTGAVFGKKLSIINLTKYLQD